MRAILTVALLMAHGSSLLRAQPAGTPTGQAARELGATPPPAPVTAPSTAPDARVPGSELTIYLMTIGSGAQVWERFGHNAIWIHDAARGTDIAYNWGMFDFNQPNFLGRFLTGETKYWMEGFEAPLMVQHYSQVENRDVFVQELALTPAQRRALADYIAWNALEANRYYRYDYYLDNCSTRVRDALDRALGGAIHRTLDTVATRTTYRWHTRRLTAGDWPVYAGIQLALGRPADVELNAWEEGFLPVRLMQSLRAVRVPGPDGAMVPLVRSERQLYRAQRAPEPVIPKDPTLRSMLIGAVLAVLFVRLGRAAAGATTGANAAALALALLGGTWALLAGVLGTALLLAGTVTRHVFMGRNVNLFFANPIWLVIAVLTVMALVSRGEARRRRARLAERVAVLGAAIAVVGLVVQLIPALRQRSWEVVWLMLPAHLGLWWALTRVEYGVARAEVDRRRWGDRRRSQERRDVEESA